MMPLGPLCYWTKVQYPIWLGSDISFISSAQVCESMRQTAVKRIGTMFCAIKDMLCERGNDCSY